MHEHYAAKIVAVSEKVIVRFSGNIMPWEGQALIYLERHVPNIPAPRLYAMYYDDKELVLVMQRMPGVQLERLWPSLTEPEKDSIISQLRQTFEKLRQAESSRPDFLGGLDGGSVHHYLFYSQGETDGHLGPFHGEAALVKALTDNYRALKQRNDHPLLKV